jgi:hypothetical protein
MQMELRRMLRISRCTSGAGRSPRSASDERHRGFLPDKADISASGFRWLRDNLSAGNADTLKAHAPPQQSAKVTP